RAGRFAPATSQGGLVLADSRRLAPRVAPRRSARRPGATRGASRLLSGRVGDSLRESHPGAAPGAPERLAERVAYYPGNQTAPATSACVGPPLRVITPACTRQARRPRHGAVGSRGAGQILRPPRGGQGRLVRRQPR